jgi:hypothetical protein
MLGQNREIDDQALLGKIEKHLTTAGFHPKLDGNSVVLKKVGFSDQSVNLKIIVSNIEGHRLISFISSVDKYKTSFERAVLAAARGNSACSITKFVIDELPLDHEHRFELTATTHLYADFVSEGELASMAFIFIKELDEIDNELREIMSPK